jgi:hypothetical protein
VVGNSVDPGRGVIEERQRRHRVDGEQGDQEPALRGREAKAAGTTGATGLRRLRLRTLAVALVWVLA